MSSKAILDRIAAADATMDQSAAHSARAREGLAAALTPYLAPGEALPDVDLVIALVQRRLAALREHMIIADEAHEEELSDDAAPRELRDDTAADLYARLMEMRELLRSLYGASALPALGFKGHTPEDPEDLLYFTRRVVIALRQGPLPHPLGASDAPDAAALVEPLVADLDDLATALEDVDREAAEAEVTLRDKQAALDRFDDGFARCVSFLAGLFSLSGDDEMAQYLRPSARRPGRLSEPHDHPTNEER